ncbi:uncharacterized protein LOC103926739 [Pyrus x bretschneideri]|uniref:uncharacterized protein LOC103926739 n=1 Tax=Pyrus x bretschneideri TaxID=225117 RepID=UPI0020300862|nr:uncharacterized protein LOC103926739 [Pyrus x bretschneideri]
MATAANSSNSPSSPNSPVNLPPSEISNPSIMSISIANVAGMIWTKLNRQNYITWRNLFIPVLKRFKLLGLVNGEGLYPPEFINLTLSEDLLPLTIGTEDSRSLWQSLKHQFSGASRIHVHGLRPKIQTIQKCDSSMTDYRSSIKDISNKLAAASKPISESDLVAYILFGFPDDYESFVDFIETCNESVTANELHNLLLSKEI